MGAPARKGGKLELEAADEFICLQSSQKARVCMLTSLPLLRPHTYITTQTVSQSGKYHLRSSGLHLGRGQENSYCSLSPKSSYR